MSKLNYYEMNIIDSNELSYTYMSTWQSMCSIWLIKLFSNKYAAFYFES